MKQVPGAGSLFCHERTLDAYVKKRISSGPPSMDPDFLMPCYIEYI
jgi:hypothetical protein